MHAVMPDVVVAKSGEDVLAELETFYRQEREKLAYPYLRPPANLCPAILGFCTD